jgi:anti-sigma factor RsiW
MNTHGRPTVTERDILAYVDGRLEAGTEYANAVEAHLAADPDARARVRAYTRQNELIRTRYSDMLAEPIPERLAPGALRATRAGRAPNGVSMSFRVAAGLAGLGCAVVIGWLAGQSTDSPLEQFADRTTAYLAGDDVAAPAGDMDSYQSAAALGGTPDFAAQGLNLVGTRQVDNGDMFEARYEDTRGRELRLFVAPDPQRHNDLLFRTQEDGRKAVYWQQGPLMYALTGDFNERDLDGLANVAIKRLGHEFAAGQFARNEDDTDKLPGAAAAISTSPGDMNVLNTESLQASQSGLDGAAGPQTGSGNAATEANPESLVNQPLPQ